jgi:hypothetical protein
MELVYFIAYIPTIVVLGIAASVAWSLAYRRQYRSGDNDLWTRASWWLAACTVLQSVHFVEEYQTGFPESVAALFGISPMPDSFFVSFNVLWIIAWGASIYGLRCHYSSALFASWFLAIAGIANGILHPVMAILTGGYFSGLITAPFVGISCWVLSRRLRDLLHGTGDRIPAT